MSISSEAFRVLLEYHWPGNVRELENVIERAVILCNGQEIMVRDLPAEIREPRAVPSPQGTPLMEGPTFQSADIPPGGEADTRMPPLSPGERLQRTGFKPRQHKAMEFIENHGFITNKYYSQLCDVSERQALRELNELVDAGTLDRIGKGRACRYVLRGRGIEG